MEESLLQVLPIFRKRRLDYIAEHCKSCPVCSQCLFVLIDGKQGARRFICAGMDGSRAFPELGVSLFTGCMKHAGPNDVFCRACRPQKLQQTALIPQEKVLEVQTFPAEDGLSVATRYLVECKCPKTLESFEALLPRKEVRADLLETFERGSLPNRRDHGNLRSQFRWLKSARMVRKAASKRQGPCKPVKKKGAQKIQKVPSHSTSGQPSGSWQSQQEQKQLPGGWLSQAYVAYLNEMSSGSEKCPIEKDKDGMKRRRCSGGIVTATLSCGVLIDFLELPRGEALDVVYTFVLDLFREFAARNVRVNAVGYDNACRLLSMAQSCQDLAPPWTYSLSLVRIVLDRFHRGNHQWCLQNVPQAGGDAVK